MSLVALNDRESLVLEDDEAVWRRDGEVQGVLSLSPDPYRAAMAGPDRLVVVHYRVSAYEDDAWVTLVAFPSGEMLAEFGEEVLKRPECLAVSPDGSRLAVAGRPERDGTYETLSSAGQTHLFELPSGRCLDLMRHEAPFFVDLVPAGLLLGTARENGLMLWNGHVFSHPDSFPAVTFGGGRYLAALADFTCLTAWDVASGQQLWTRQVHDQRDECVTLVGHREADRFVLLLPDEQIQVWGAGERPLAAGKLAAERLPYEEAALSPSGQVLHYFATDGVRGEALPECYGC